MAMMEPKELDQYAWEDTEPPEMNDDDFIYFWVMAGIYNRYRRQAFDRADAANHKKRLLRYRESIRLMRYTDFKYMESLLAMQRMPKQLLQCDTCRAVYDIMIGLIPEQYRRDQ